ncbi:HNH endonuclease signature motif containing protein [Arthrobacter cryoconiti]|uniref:HNH endonuclease signature motif containing protein n=1 Tax=Arthrobacter cryoconiti TaxID=748907 RepID=A0ABV8QW58_9MICC
MGRTHRFYSAAQRKLLAARDKGCSFPDCTATIYQCEAHHVHSWQDGGETDVATGALLCQVHHTLIHTGSWTASMIGGVPNYTPSYRIDPTRTPRHNSYHHATPRTPKTL